MTNLAIFGDVHQKYDKFLPICEKLLEDGYYILQIGDMGFNYDALEHLPVGKFSWFNGNHEKHPDCYQQKHNLGKFGIHPMFPEIFFVAGGFSIDRKWRRLGVNYWTEEELSWSELQEAKELYVKIKPRYLLCHEAPRNWANIIGNPEILKECEFNPDTFSTRTSDVLQTMVENHKPEMVITGHYHCDRKQIMGGITYITLNELNYMILEIESKP